MDTDVLVVGAGLAGLCCARGLARRGIATVVLEAADEVGGRVRTDTIDGFRLDRGFQVLSTAYAEARAALDFDALRLGRFRPGARIRLGDGTVTRLADPLREPTAALAGLTSPVGTFIDKLRVLQLRRQVLGREPDEIWARPQMPTEQYLREFGFSERIVERFFRPFYGGVFLERGLRTSSRKFEYTFRCFAEGDAALPAGGMGAIPHQLARSLPTGTVRTDKRVVRIDDDACGVELADGTHMRGRAVVLASDGPAAHDLWPELGDPGSVALGAHLAFDAPQAPFDEPILMLDGSGEGPVNDLCVPSRVAADYAPEGRELVSASVVDAGRAAELSADDELERAVRTQLREWFGAAVDDWRLLRVLRIAHALPRQECADLEPHQRAVAVPARDGSNALYVCGDHREDGSIQGAMVSGRRAALAVAATFA